MKFKIFIFLVFFSTFFWAQVPKITSFSPVSAEVGDSVKLSGSGNVTDGTNGYIIAESLALLDGDVNLNNTSNNISTIAGGDNTTRLKSLSFTDASGGLTIGMVNPTGI